jgi:hypothetical protein
MEKGFSRKVAKAQRKRQGGLNSSCGFLCAFASLREKFLTGEDAEVSSLRQS